MTELEFVRAAEHWPKWPVLPVINRKDRRAGFLWSDLPDVFIGNIYRLPTGTFEAATQGLEKIEYASFEAMLEEWRVD